MKKIISIVCIIAILTAVFAFAGCGDKKEKVEPTEATIEETTEAANEDTEIPKQSKQDIYDSLLKDVSKIDLVANNLSISSSGAGVLTEVLKSSNGDVKLSMKLSDDAYYISYAIDNDTYMEMHVPEVLKTDKEGKEFTSPAETYYYKTTGIENYDPKVMSPISNVEEMLQGFKSVKYIETKEINGVKCDVVETIKEISMADRESGEVSNNETPSNNEPKQVFYNLYFTETDNKFYGCSITEDNVTTTLYCSENVDIKLPKADFKGIKEEDIYIIENQISDMLMGASQSGTSIDPTE